MDNLLVFVSCLARQAVSRIYISKCCSKFILNFHESFGACGSPQ
jgi:hypothetical protein